MTTHWLCSTVIVLTCIAGYGLAQDQAESSIPLGVIRVELPAEAVTISYVEAKEGKALLVTAKDTSVRARRLYLGDGKVGVELEATEDGVRMQGGLTSDPGFEFARGAAIVLPADCTKAAQLKPGDVYVIAPGIVFEVEKK